LNEYTRREEIRWTLATVAVLVPAVAIAIVKLVMAQGPMITNPEAIKAADEAMRHKASYEVCSKTSQKLKDEVSVFRSRAAQAEKDAKDKTAKKKKKARYPDKVKAIEPLIPWSAAAPVLKYARRLREAKCRSQTEAVVGKDEDSLLAWKAIRKAAKIKDPGSKKEKREAARGLHKYFKKAPVDKLQEHSAKAATTLETRVTAALNKRDKDLIRASLPQGLFPRGAAIGVGVGVSLAALIISYISVRSASVRRGKTLVSLRRFANTPEAGLQAAAIVRLAAHHNGGEPGMVVGSALGGLVAALLSPTDDPNIFIADLFVAGSMGGLLIGLAAQWLTRTLTGTRNWRERTKELGDIEKPTIPVALMLGGVTPGLEKQFLRYFEALPVADAAMVVQKLAAQAEEQILAAADAASQGQGPPGMPAPDAPTPWGGPEAPGGMVPPGGAPPGGPAGYG